MAERARRNVRRLVAKPRLRAGDVAWFGKYLSGVETEYEYKIGHGGEWFETSASNANHQHRFYGRPVRSREVTPWEVWPRPADTEGGEQ